MSESRVDRAQSLARVEEIRTRARRAARRRTVLITGSAVLVVAVLVGLVVVVVGREQGRQAAARAAAAAPIEGVATSKDLGRDHVTDPVVYPQQPPVGGDHSQVWTTCGVYTTPTVTEQSVHSMEHGAVWITYRPDLAPDQVATLTTLAAKNDYVLVSLFAKQENPVEASAWGVQLGMESTDDPRLAVFVEKYQQGPQTPEPGAACAGGAGAA